jgi:acetylornithine deacetylase/succinyl-diaminopimelate desuccinylase-like protein
VGVAQQAIDDVSRLVAIPSVSLAGHDRSALEESAETVAALLAGTGAAVETLRVADAPPAVYAEVDIGAPTTVLLYAHHDVQPVGDEAAWQTPPFKPEVRGDRLYGRGAADDKAGIFVHAAALRYFDGAPPVNIKVLVEGEEEVGSPHLAELIGRYPTVTAADVVVVTDCANWALGVPALTVSLRGMVSCYVTVTTLEHAVHGGLYGGAIPDALSALAGLLSSLQTDSGDVAIDGLLTGDIPAKSAFDEQELRRAAGVVEGVDLIGSGTLAERLWARPAATVLGIDAPAANGAPAQLVPNARAKVAVRLAPGDDAQRAMADLEAHVRTHTPWGARVDFEPLEVVAPFAIDGRRARELALRALAEAWNTKPAEIGVGGSIAFLAPLAEAAPQAEFLLTAVEDPDANIHGPNESVHLGELERACEAEIRLLSYLAEDDGENAT